MKLTCPNCKRPFTDDMNEQVEHMVGVLTKALAANPPRPNCEVTPHVVGCPDCRSFAKLIDQKLVPLTPTERFELEFLAAEQLAAGFALSEGMKQSVMTMIDTPNVGAMK